MKRRMQMLNWMVSIFLYLSAISPASAWLSDPIDFYEGKGSWILNGIEYAYNVDSGEAQIKKIDEDQVGAVSLRVPTIVRLPRRYRFDIVVDPAQDTGDPNNDMRIGIDWSDYLVTSIANRACVCGRITSLTIPSNIKRIGDEAFDSCLDLERLIFEGDVDSLGKNAFSMCKSLEYVRLKSVKEIGNNVFAVCDSLKTVVYDGEIERIGENMFGGCTALTQLVWPRGLKEIGDWAYSGTGITELRELPLGVTLGASVFGGCQDLREVCWPSSHSYIPYGTFGGCGNLCKLSIPGQVIMIGEEAFSWCDNLVDVTFSEGLLEIGTNAFQSCTGLSNVSFPDTLQIIRYGAFSFDANLDVEHWPKDLSIVEESSFWNCLALTNLDLSSTQISEIGGGAFSESDELVSIIFPESLVKIGDYAFYTHRWYLSETIVYFMGKPPQMGSGVFYRAIESGSLAGEVHRWFHTARYLPEFKEEWMEAIAAWKSENEGFGEWQGLDFQTEIDVEPTDWRLLADGKTQFLTISWYIPTNENYSINQSLRDLTAKDLRFSIWRSQGDDENWRSFENAECIAQNLAGTDFTDFAFGKIKGTCPVRYWVEVQDKHGEPTSPAERAQPHVEPARCTTRRRFGLAVGLSTYDKSAYGKHVSPGLACFERDTDEFVRQLRSSGGVEHEEDVKVLKNSEAIYDRIGQYVREMPFKNGKERFVPGDIVFLWMASHGVNIGGIDAYDGYYLSGRGERWELNSSVGRCATFPDDLSWIRERPGVRLIGILPFCHAEWFAKEFDGLPNVAWICAAKTSEEAANTTRATSQFNQYFLNFGVSKGLACQPKVKGSPYQEVQSFEIPKTIGDGNDVLTCGELARYGKTLAFGCSNTNASHAVLVNEPVLDSVVVKENVKPVAGSAPERVKLMMRQDESGAIRVYFSYPKSQTDIILWHRKKDSGRWQWSSVYTSDRMKSLGLLDKLTTVNWSWSWNDPDLLPIGFHAYVLFGAHTSNECSHFGWIEPDTEYEFAIQCVNEYGFGSVRNGGFFKTGKDLPIPPREVFIEHFKELVHYQGVFSAANGSTSGEASVDVSPDDGGWMVTARLSCQGEKVCYSGFVSDSAVDDNGCMDVKLTKSAEDVHLVQTTLKAMGSAGSSAVYPDELSLKIGVTGVSGLADGIDIVCIPVDEVDLGEDAADVACPGVQFQVDPPVSSLLGEVSYSAKSLPKGLSIDSSTGVISGTPTVPGAYVVLVTVKSKTDPTQTETIEVPIVIGNYVDETIAVNDEYGPFVPGEKVELKFPEGAAWKVTGLPTGLKWDAKLPGVTGVPTKPGTNTVTFTWTDKSVTPNVEHKASATFIVGPLPLLSVQVAGEGTGKVTGAGAYAANKKVTLKATADTKDAAAKGKNPATVKSVFAGWYDAVGELVAQTPSLSYVMPPYDVTLQARFIPASNDWATADCVTDAGSVLVVSNETKVAIAPISVVVAGGSLPTVKVAGLPSGLKFTTKDILKKGSKTEVDIPANTIYGTPTKGGVYNATVTVTTAGKVSVVRVIKFIIRTASDYVADADWDPVQGKVTGAGVYQAGKKATLKATANKGYVFSGWYDGDALVSRLASYVLTMPTNDVAYVAKFVTAEEDAASIEATVADFAFGAAAEDGGSTGNATNVMCGVYLEWPVAASALSQPTVAVSGLPAGLKFTAKPVTSKVGTGKTAVTVTNVPPNTIYGAPTSASKTDKKGKVTPSKVKVTVTTAGKSKAEYVIDLTVDPLPAWAQGEFCGLASTAEGRLGSASMSVTAAGKISGKVIVNGTNCTFTASSYDITSKTIGETNLVAVVTGKLGKGAVTGGIAVVASGASGTFAGAEMTLCRNVWKDKGADPVPEDAQGLYTVKLGAGERGTGYLSLTVDKKGAVKVAGKAPDGTTLSGAATLMPNGDGAYFADVFCAPSAYKGGYVAGRLSWDADSRVSSDGLDWTSFNPESTADYYAGGFDRDLSASGAWYSKTDSLANYYTTLDFKAKNGGVGQACWENLTISVDQTGKKFVVDQKKSTPVQDKATKAWSYGGANDAALAISFTQATGIWKGSFLWWFDEPKHTSQKIPFEGIMVQGEDLEGFGTYDVQSSYIPYDKKGNPLKTKTYKFKESVPVLFTSQP